jgi:hypothetical protein
MFWRDAEDEGGIVGEGPVGRDDTLSDEIRTPTKRG